MTAKELSIVIPARNEEFLAKTVENVLENIEADTEIIVILDGAWADPPLPKHERVNVLYHPVAIGQRAATNKGVRTSQAKYIMKLDAHCAVDKGFDRKLLADMQDNWTVVPAQYNLHVFNWKCPKCGQEWYQGQTPTRCMIDTRNNIAENPNCSNTEGFFKNMVWQPRLSRRTEVWQFDTTLHFQYGGNSTGGDLSETMSILGACWMLTREKYWELNICDEKHGSWGQQGVEVSCKTWLSGGKVMVNRKTWFAHLFRTQGGDFGFPYPNPGVDKARDYSRDIWFNNKFEKQIYPLSWLVEKFAPLITDEKHFIAWHDKSGKEVLDRVNKAGEEFYARNKKLTKGIVYYTDSEISEEIAKPCRDQLKKAAGDIPIISVSLKPVDLGKNITLPLKRGYLTMFKQILAGLEAMDTDIVFFAEHDILYHPSHFEFTPQDKEIFYYNQNVWQVRAEDGHALYYDCNKLSQLCAYRESLLTHYRERVQRAEEAAKLYGEDSEEFRRVIRKMGFEPGTNKRITWDHTFADKPYRSAKSNIDIRHNQNLTPSRWRQEQFRNQRNCQNWQEADQIEGWGVTKNNFNQILASI